MDVFIKDLVIANVVMRCNDSLCAGPGPGRYVLPSGVGYVKHDPSKRVYPAYSFGQKLSDVSK